MKNDQTWGAMLPAIMILGGGLLGAILLPGYVWLASGNADISTIGLYRFVTVIAIPAGFVAGAWLGALTLLAGCFIMTIVNLCRPARKPLQRGGHAGPEDSASEAQRHRS